MSPSLVSTMQALIPLTVALHIASSPYTKVEESFTLHAVRDIVIHGSDLAQYDHLVHPGPLPRSFIPPLVIAAVCKPVIAVLDKLWSDRNPMVDQLVVRLALGMLNSGALVAVSNCLAKKFGKAEARIWILFTVGQFHACWWAGRPVPNVGALAITTLVLSFVIQALPNPTMQRKQVLIATALLALAASIVRAETALLLLGLVLALAIKETRAGTGLQLTRNVTATAVIVGLAGTALSVAVDSFFWSAWLASARDVPTATGVKATIEQTLQALGFGKLWIWPELWGVLFNVVEGKSELWGTSAWYTYLVPFLPKMLLSALPLAFVAPLEPAARRALQGWKAVLGSPVVVMVAGMSCLGHKEWRFIIYVVPWINALAAISCGQIWRARRRHHQTIFSRLLLLALVGGIIANFFVTAGLAYISHHNYPGGAAMEMLHTLRPADHAVRVFLPPGPRMTGASAYTYAYAPPHGRWEYNTTETDALETAAKVWEAEFDYVVTDEMGAYDNERWEKVRGVEAFAGVERRKGLMPVGVRWREVMGVFARRNTEGA